MSSAAAKRDNLYQLIATQALADGPIHSPWLVVRHPLPQTDEPLVSGVDRQSVPVHQDSLVTFSEVQRPETETDFSVGNVLTGSSPKT